MLILPLTIFLACTAQKGESSPDSFPLDTAAIDLDGDGFLARVDCDDEREEIHPGAADASGDGIDQNCDGADGDGQTVDQDGDGYPQAVDCNDNDAEIHPNATDIAADGVDQNCDGVDATAALIDADHDGFLESVDCDDANAAIHPGAADLPGDGVDQDCNGSDAEPFVNHDVDADGFPDTVDCNDNDGTIHPGAVDTVGDGIDQDCDGQDAPAPLVDADGDGVLSTSDCDDANRGIHPGATDIPSDGVDQDCDGVDASPPLVDGDQDGALSTVDCNDADASIYPGAYDTPSDGIDQDCNGTDASAGGSNDFDQDGFSSSVDCDDNNSLIHPGAIEKWYDGVDQDCDGASDYDQDGDGYTSSAYGGTDCDDTSASTNPGASEVWYDGVNENCAGFSDYDQDGDGYISADFGGSDCDDLSSSVHPSAKETWYDGVDQDCDGADDYDQDGDGVDSSSHGGTDCKDTSASIYPGATEILDDGVDQDCDGYDLASILGLQAGDLVITEIMADPLAVADAYGEWFEVYNANGTPVDLDGLVVDDGTGLSFTVSGTLEVAAGDFVLFNRDGDTVVNGGLVADYDYRSDLEFSNAGSSLTLKAGATTIDSVSWSAATYFPDTEGAAMALDTAHLDATSNDDGQYWCVATAAFGLGDDGTPGAANTACPNMTDADHDGWVTAWDCNDHNSSVYPGATETARDGVDSDCDGADFSASSLKVGDLVITEIMYDPSFVSDADGEWFEVYNKSGYTVNLNGLVVADDAAYGAADQFVVTTDLLVTSKSRLIFAAKGDSTINGGITVDYDYKGAGVNLNNTLDDIYLGIPSGASYTTIDSVSYDEGSGWPIAKGGSMELSASKIDSTSNNTASNWCLATQVIPGSTDLGSPGAASSGC